MKFKYDTRNQIKYYEVFSFNVKNDLKNSFMKNLENNLCVNDIVQNFVN